MEQPQVDAESDIEVANGVGLEGSESDNLEAIIVKVQNSTEKSQEQNQRNSIRGSCSS